jgi:AcrR family transcriptional regulator
MDWVEAALRAIGRGGLAAVAVEKLAVELDTTKGSFYWHFRSRREVIEAALELWEQRHTEAIIAEVDREASALERLRRLFTLVVHGPGRGLVDIALLASADDPVVHSALERVTERRISYMVGLFGELGFSPAEARHRGLLAHSAYLGHVQLMRAMPEVVNLTSESLPGHVEGLLSVLVGSR